MKETNIELSYEMYEELKETLVKAIKTEVAANTLATTPATDSDLPQRMERLAQLEQARHKQLMEHLAGQLVGIERKNAATLTGIERLQTTVATIEIPDELPPRITQHRVSFALESEGVFWALVGMAAAIAMLCTMLYWAAKPNYDRIDNDLKYRYIKMKGEASPDRIAELEQIFELNRDNAKIRQLKHNVEQFEQTIRQKIILEEQARQKKQAAQKFKNRAESLQRK